jgi:osmotically inducible protein OsmC
MAPDNTQQQAAVITPMLRNFMGRRRFVRVSCKNSGTVRIYSAALVFYQAISVQPTEQSMPTTSGSAKWQGGIKDGKGAISTKSGALSDYPYGFASRFEGKPGSNPEELIGAAHAACFTMALSLILGEAKLTAEQMETKADVTLEKVADGFAITSVHLTLKAKIPGADKAKFDELTGKAKAGCPVSKVLNTKITLDATLL